MDAYTLDRYSERKKHRERAGSSLPLTSEIPTNEIRERIWFIINDSIGEPVSDPSPGYSRLSNEPYRAHWQDIDDILDRWFGSRLQGGFDGNSSQRVKVRLLTQSTDQVLDILEATFCVLSQRRDLRHKTGDPTRRLQFFTANLNKLLYEYDLTYQLIDGRITTLDSHFVHAEVVAPAVALLHDAGFEAPNSEFMLAHEHYRHGDYESAINEATKALESTIRLICRTRSWSYEPDANMRQLVQTVKRNGLFPSYLENMTNNLATILESGPTTIRNKQASHSGVDRERADRDLAMFAIHLSGSCIVFLVKRNSTLPR